MQTATNVLENVPLGKKENVYFVVANVKNVEKRDVKCKAQYYDDCGVWDSRKGTSFVYVKVNIGWSKAYKRNVLMCQQKQVNKVQTYVQMEPQPIEDTILIMNKNYFKCLKCLKSSM